MPAIVIHAANDLRLEDRTAPEPGPGEVMVRIGRGGICGSDLHYVRHGGFGPVRLAEPMVLGHEVAGTIERVGADVADLAAGAPVAVNPSLPCGQCRFCRDGLANQCSDMRFFGSAMRRPHVQGAFSSAITVKARQIVPLPAGLSVETAAFAEPLAVALHAVARAGVGPGDRVVISGMGPIGTLILLAAREAGAAEIVVADVLAEPLAMAQRLGADAALDLAADPDALAPFGAERGYFDIGIEASGAPKALGALVTVVRPRGRIVQVGLGGDLAVPAMPLVSKEIEIAGAFRFDTEFVRAIALLGAGAIDVAPMLTEVFPVARAHDAFTLAADKSRAMKVQIAF